MEEEEDPTTVLQSSNSITTIALHRRESSLSSYHTTCISKHYALNHQILGAFESHYNNQLWLVAFYLGLKFVETALLEIPKHGYFYSNKFEHLRLQATVEALQVCHSLQAIIAKEPAQLAKECHKVERLHYLAMQQYEHLEFYDQTRQQVQKELDQAYGKGRELASSTIATSAASSTKKNGARGPLPNDARSTASTNSNGSTTSNHTLASTFLACGDSFSSVFCPGTTLAAATTTTYSDSFPDAAAAATTAPALRSSQSASARSPRRAFPESQGSPRRMALFPPEGRQPDHSTTTSHDNGASATRFGYPSLPRDGVAPSVAKSVSKFGTISAGSLLDDDDNEGYHSSRITDSPRRDNNQPERNSVVSKPDQKEPLSMTYNHDKSSTFPATTRERASIATPTDGRRSRAPPPYQFVKAQSEYNLQRALFVSGLQVDVPKPTTTLQSPPIVRPLSPQVSSSEDVAAAPSNEPFAPPGAKKRDASMVLSLGPLKSCYHEDFDALRINGRILVRRLPTYQGRVPGSINGCTIIAPLICIHHFFNDHFIPDDGLPDQVIVNVIDEETPNILPIVRQNLGLVKDAFLIPADAHESLMEMQYMCQEQFLTVCGGNVLEPQHLEPLVEEMSKVGPKKVAATLFFHEHVITILQLRRGDDRVWFDVIDSLPHEDTFLRMGESTTTTTTTTARSSVSASQRSSDIAGASSPANSDSPTRSDSDMVDPGNVGTTYELEHSTSSSSAVALGASLLSFFTTPSTPKPQTASRIRCLDADSLRATILWYACSVFTTEDEAYIDAYQWDERLSDFDPRVFQAYIWKEAE